jgi:hypothetical protein
VTGPAIRPSRVPARPTNGNEVRATDSAVPGIDIGGLERYLPTVLADYDPAAGLAGAAPAQLEMGLLVAAGKGLAGLAS